jgi:hypothetical protein
MYTQTSVKGEVEVEDMCNWFNLKQLFQSLLPFDPLPIECCDPSSPIQKLRIHNNYFSNI